MLIGWPRLSIILSLMAILFLGASTGRAQDSAGDRPLMRAVILPDLIPSVTQQLVPMTVDLAQATGASRRSRVKIVGLSYCGGDGNGNANAIGVIYPDGEAAVSNAISPSSCQTPLSDIAAQLARAPNAPRWLEVARMRVSWRPWHLGFAVTDSARAGKDADSAPSLKNVPELKSITTANLQLLPPPGQNFRFNVAIGFLKSTIVAALFAGGSSADPAPYLTRDSVDAVMAGVPSNANLLAEARYPFINQMLKVYAPTYQVPIKFEGMQQALTARNVSVAGGDNVVTVSGLLEYGGIGGYKSTVRCEGEDLRVSQITLEAPGANCNDDDMVARMQCQAQAMALSASSGTLASALTNYYQGQNFHYSTSDRPLYFTIGDAEFTAAFEALKSSSRGSTFSEAGRATIARQSN